MSCDLFSFLFCALGMIGIMAGAVLLCVRSEYRDEKRGLGADP